MEGNGLHPNYEYALAKCREYAPGGAILDFGCGGGACIRKGRAIGLNMIGVDIFQDKGDRHAVVSTGLLGTLVFEIAEGGALPLGDGQFDFAFCNMVFEHVADIRSVLSEIARVLRPGGRFLAMFPGKEVVWEAHLGIPFIHWFPKQSSLRYPYLRALRTLGLGRGREGAPPSEWARLQLKWLDDYTFYRTRREIESSFAAAGFSTGHLEEDYVGFRLERRGLAAAARVASRGLSVPVSWLATASKR